VVESPKRMSARDKVEREMLKLVARDPAVFTAYADELTDEHIRSVKGRAALAALRASGGDVGAIAGQDDEALGALVASLAVEPLDGDGSKEYAASVHDRLQEFVLKGKSDALRMELQKMNPLTDEGYDALFNELVAVDGDLRRLRQHTRSVV
jgi:hypothetical protein